MGALEQSNSMMNGQLLLYQTWASLSLMEKYRAKKEIYQGQEQKHYFNTALVSF